MSTEPINNIADVPPTIAGPYGEAWEQTPHVLIQRPTTVAIWIVRAPWGHPFWSYYALSCCSLRDVPGVPPAIRYLDDATHELFIAAMNPDYAPTLQGPNHVLRPLNFAGQFIADDREAAERVRQSVVEIISGKLNPDSDGVQQWIARYGAHMVKGH